MIYRVFFKLMTRHVLWHLVVPVAIGLVCEWYFDSPQLSAGASPPNITPSSYAPVRADRTNASTNDARGSSASVKSTAAGEGSIRSLGRFLRRRVPFFAGASATFLVVAFLLMYHETNVQVDPADLAELRELLKSSTEFFALSATELHEWFKPYFQVYWSLSAAQRLYRPDFKACRVLLFFTKGQLSDARSDFLEGLNAKGFRDIHRHFGIPLAYLRPREVKQILGATSRADLINMGCLNTWLAKAPQWVVSWRINTRRRRRRFKFALVTVCPNTLRAPATPVGPSVAPATPIAAASSVASCAATAHKQVLVKFTGRHGAIALEFVEDPVTLKPYQDFVGRIKAELFGPSDTLLPQHDFRNAIY
jgi:hypothetical protein